MATIKIKFRPSTVAGREGSIFYRITHNRSVRCITSTHHIYPHEWDNRRGAIHLDVDLSRRQLFVIAEQVRLDVERINRIIRRFDLKNLPYSADNVADAYTHYIDNCSLTVYMRAIIEQLARNGKTRTSETYRATLNNFVHFLAAHADYRSNGCYDVMIDTISSDMMQAYQAWNQSRGLVPNTISFYTRILRAVYNRAVDSEIIENRHPFRLVYTGIDKTVKRALPINDIRRIRSLNLAYNPRLDYARDMFMLSFFMRGMSFIDMAFLRKSDLRDGYIIYRRRKTGQLLTIRWTGEMQQILDKYPENDSSYLLPIIRTDTVNERCAYRNTSYCINRNLKHIARLAGIAIPLSLYVARHSWASAAKTNGIPLSVISEGMGHDSETTTRIYLASLDTAIVDRANALIIKSL